MILWLWLERRFAHITSAEIIATSASKLSLPDLQRGRDLTTIDVQQLVALLRDQSVVIPPEQIDRTVVTGDPEDDGVLATAVAGGAQYLVTGDRALLSLSE
jgi:putative PIN family toxin of toxin-antitoxin system